MSEITLNGYQFPIKGKVRERVISPWTAKIASGSVDFGSFQPCDILEYADCRGGIGLETAKAESDQVWWSEGVETTKERYITLGPLVSSAGNFGTPLLKACDFGGVTYFFGNEVTKYWNGTALSEGINETLNEAYASDLAASAAATDTTYAAYYAADLAASTAATDAYYSACYAADLASWTAVFANNLLTADDHPLASPTDAATYKDDTASYIVVCNGVSARYASVGYGSTKTWAALTTSPVKYLSSLDNRLIGVNSTGTIVYYSAQNNIDDCAGAAMLSFNISGPWTSVTKLFNGTLAGTEEPALFMVTDTCLVWIDFWTQRAYQMEVRYASPYALTGMYWNSELYVANGSGIVKIGSSLVTQYGPDQKDGLPATYGGYIYDILGTSHWVVCAISGDTYSTILKRHESLGGWHQIYSSVDNIRCIHYSSASSPGKLWFQDGNYIKYIPLPDRTHDVTKVTGYTYTGTGSIIFPRMTKLSVIPKTAVKVEALTESCDATNYIDVYLRTDTTSTWGTAVGRFNSNGHPTPITLGSSAGTAFNDVQCKVVLVGSASSASPVLKALVLKFVPNPPAVTSWSFVLNAKGEKAKLYMDKLVTARDATTLISFSPVGNTTKSLKWVKIEQMPSTQEFDDPNIEKEFQVVVNEVS
jgi:hypothetical protein